MLNGISNNNVDVRKIDKTITSDSSDRFEMSVKFTAYCTLVLAFILLTIAFWECRNTSERIGTHPDPSRGIRTCLNAY